MSPRAGLPWHTRRFLAVFYVVGFVSGLLAPAEQSDLDLVLAIGMGFAMAWWTITDASDHGRPVRPVAKVLVMLLGWIAAPVYLIVSRRLRGVGWLLLNSVCYAAVVAAGFGFGEAFRRL